MTRPARHRLVIAAVTAAGLLAGPRLPEPLPWVLLGLFAPLLAAVVVAVQPLLGARRALALGRFDDAAARLAAFEVSLGASPLRRALAGLGVGLYTSNPLAAARGTLGAVRLEQGRLDDAAQHLHAALALDPGYAVPHANLAVLHATRGDAAAAEAARKSAADLGFSPRALARVVSQRLGAR